MDFYFMDEKVGPTSLERFANGEWDPNEYESKRMAMELLFRRTSPGVEVPPILNGEWYKAE